MKFSKILLPVFVLSLFTSQVAEAAGWRRAARSIAESGRNGFVAGAHVMAAIAGGSVGVVVVVSGGTAAVVGVIDCYKIFCDEADARKKRPPTGGGIALSPDINENAISRGTSDTKVGTDEYGHQCSFLDVLVGRCKSVSFEQEAENGETQLVIAIREGDEEMLELLTKKYGRPVLLDKR